MFWIGFLWGWMVVGALDSFLFMGMVVVGALEVWELGVGTVGCG